jgi:hypothetical protein
MCKDWEHVHFCNGSYVYQHKPVHSYWCPKTCKACSSVAAASGQARLASAGGRRACALIITAEHLALRQLLPEALLPCTCHSNAVMRTASVGCSVHQLARLRGSGTAPQRPHGTLLQQITC